MSGADGFVGATVRCPDCGKCRYPTRADAKRVAKRRHPGEHLAPYRCGAFWHLGHLPAAAVYGSKGRGEVYGR